MATGTVKWFNGAEGFGHQKRLRNRDADALAVMI